ERAYTEAWLKNVPERKILESRMKSLWNFERMPKREEGAGYVVRGGRALYLKQSGLQNQPVLYVRDLPHGAPRPLIDVNRLAVDGTVALSVWEPSYDGKYLAFGLAKAGSDWQQFQVRDVASGKDLADKLEWIKFSSPVWSRDSKGM